MKAIELLHEHREELTPEAIAVLEKADNYSLSVTFIDGDSEYFNSQIAENPHSFDEVLGIN